MSCTGSCCEAFWLGRDQAQKIREEPESVWDGPYIADMLVDLTQADVDRVYGSDSGREAEDYFTCRHWDQATRLCREYESRPTMCSEFPYGNDCPSGCGLKCGTPSGDWLKSGLLPMHNAK